MEVERLLVKQNAMAIEKRQVDHRATPASTRKGRKKLGRLAHMQVRNHTMAMHIFSSLLKVGSH